MPPNDLLLGDRDTTIGPWTIDPVRTRGVVCHCRHTETCELRALVHERKAGGWKWAVWRPGSEISGASTGRADSLEEAKAAADEALAVLATMDASAMELA